MSRLQTVDPKTAQGRAKELFDGPLKGMHLNVFKNMANSPAAVDAYLGMSGALKGGLLTDAEREAIALAVSQANDCQYCLAAHTGLAKMAGLTPDQMLAARRGNLDDAKLHTLVTFARNLNEKRGWLEDTDLIAMRSAGYTDGHIAETVAVYAMTIFSNYFNHVNDTDVDIPKAPPLD